MKFQDQEKTLPVYKVKMLSEEETREIADKVFKTHNAGIDSTRDDIYTETAVYYSDDGNRYSIWIDYKGGSYHIVDYGASFPEDDSEVVYKTIATEAEIRQMLLKYTVEVPEKAIFENCGDGTYQFTAKMSEDDAGYVYDGVITCKLTENDEFTDITNSMMAYEKYKDFQCISEVQAYNEVLDGKFRQSMLDGKLSITQLEIQYQIDSKGYVQPVYVFDNENQDNGIVIPALK